MDLEIEIEIETAGAPATKRALSFPASAGAVATAAIVELARDVVCIDVAWRAAPRFVVRLYPPGADPPEVGAGAVYMLYGAGLGRASRRLLALWERAGLRPGRIAWENPVRTFELNAGLAPALAAIERLQSEHPA